MNIIVAMNKAGVIGDNGELPWDIPADLKHFRNLTINSTVVMGRKTFQSLGGKPLPSRRNIVLSKTLNKDTSGVEVYRGISDVLDLKLSSVWVIGGVEVYRQLLPFSNNMHVTWVFDNNVKGDARFPVVKWGEWESMSQVYSDQDPDPDKHIMFEHFKRTYVQRG